MPAIKKQMINLVKKFVYKLRIQHNWAFFAPKINCRLSESPLYDHKTLSWIETSYQLKVAPTVKKKIHTHIHTTFSIFHQTSLAKPWPWRKNWAEKKEDLVGRKGGHGPWPWRWSAAACNSGVRPWPYLAKGFIDLFSEPN